MDRYDMESAYGLHQGQRRLRQLLCGAVFRAVSRRAAGDHGAGAGFHHEFLLADGEFEAAGEDVRHLIVWVLVMLSIILTRR